jgi:hypothetical protein
VTIIRSKFRHLTLSDHGDSQRSRLLPVMPRTKWDPEGSEENRLFWEATPSGEGEVITSWLPPESRAPGSSCVYIDVQPHVPLADLAAGEIPWQLGSVELNPLYGQVRFSLSPQGKAGRLEFGITAPAASLLLLPYLAREMEERLRWRQANEESSAVYEARRWRVVFLPA